MVTFCNKFTAPTLRRKNSDYLDPQLWLPAAVALHHLHPHQDPPLVSGLHHVHLSLVLALYCHHLHPHLPQP